MSETTTPDFLKWLRDRLIYVYREDPNVDFVLRLNECIREFDEARFRFTEITKIAREMSFKLGVKK